ncbi:amidohydrolase family protein [Enterocloster clostridioformis]|uniref:amidohydrolase family protein n=1 Tax=Enterocloster clostridioformis TaxID=1531 RepID=UPI0023308341|nr:amidohydrolase family protein [Enterocloster clostridioformis]MDB2134756.1 amidohydrolase family protein [Enterocloster clostridioformis]
MKNKKQKYAILTENKELGLAPNGDFVIKKDLVDKYEIIDFHCHSYEGLYQLFPPFLQKKKTDYNRSLMDMSCFPFSMKLFDLNKVYFSGCPTTLFSFDGLKTRIKLFTGAFVLNYGTTEKLLIDMDNNGISKAVIQQINPPDKNSADLMEKIVTQSDRLYTFGAIHPFDKNIDEKIKHYMNLHIKGWKINPHVCGFSIDCKEALALIEKLSKTDLPILCCSGLGFPQEVLSTSIPPKQTKKDVLNQMLDKYETVLSTFPNTTFILAHGGCFEFEKMVNLLQTHRNMYTDISIQPAAHIKTLIEKVGAERLLFGTDYPFVTQAFSILSVLRATENEKERTLIFSENAKSLLDDSSKRLQV